MVTPTKKEGESTPETTPVTERTPVGGATPVNNAFDANNGGSRIANPKVAVHVKPMGSTPGNNNARRSSAQMNNNQNGNGGNFGFGGHPNNQNNGNQQPNNQFRVNQDLVLDFGLLDASIGQKTQFGTTKLGAFLNNLVANPTINAKLNVDWDSETASYIITIGKAHVMWVTGLANSNSPSHTLPTRIVNPYSFGMTGKRMKDIS